MKRYKLRWQCVPLRWRGYVLHGKAAARLGTARHSNGMEMHRVATELLS